MTTFSSLTPDQQGQLLAFMQIFRPNIGLTARALNQMAQMDGLWQTTVLPIVTGLDPGTPIPDVTGLAGAATLLREDVIALMSAIESVLTNYNGPANRTEFVKAAGLPNTIG